MEEFYKWFFLEEGRSGDALFSLPHLLSVTITLAIFFFLAVFLGKKFKTNSKAQTITLLIAGILIVLVEVFKLLFLVLEYGQADPFDTLIGNAPLYLCDMAIFVIPLCALTRGRFRDWCMDFVAIWGILMAIFGTYLAGNIYPTHAAISFLAINSLLNHAISGFAGLFIFVCGLNKMEKRNIPFVVGILVVFMTTALIVDYVDDHNFMFFFHGDGTPFTFWDQYLSFGLKPIYQAWIYVLQCGYMVGFYYAYYGIKALINKHKNK